MLGLAEAALAGAGWLLLAVGVAAYLAEVFRLPRGRAARSEARKASVSSLNCPGGGGPAAGGLFGEG
jgi:hypothetical protein